MVIASRNSRPVRPVNLWDGQREVRRQAKVETNIRTVCCTLMYFHGDHVSAGSQSGYRQIDREPKCAIVQNGREREGGVGDNAGWQVAAINFRAVQVNNGAIVAQKPEL